MGIEVLKTLVKSPLALVAAAVLLAASGCTTAAPTNSAAPSAPTTSASPAATPAANASAAGANGAAAASLPVTLPVLDAMFADEAFAGELKSKLQLSDEQIERLRVVAREGTSGLDEKAAEAGKTSDATRAAEEKIKSVVGPEKAQSFMAFVRE